MKSLFGHSVEEKKAVAAAVNLFFSVVLGANLGSINTLALNDYAVLLLLLAGAVMGIYTIAVTKRRRVAWSTAAVYALILGGMVLLPSLRPARMEEELLRIVVTLAVWLLLLVVVRFSPLIAEPESGHPPMIEDSDDIADSLADGRRS